MKDEIYIKDMYLELHCVLKSFILNLSQLIAITILKVPYEVDLKIEEEKHRAPPHDFDYLTLGKIY